MVTEVYYSLSSTAALASTLAALAFAVVLLPMMGIRLPFTAPKWTCKDKVSDV